MILKMIIGLISILTGLFGFWVIANSEILASMHSLDAVALPLASGVLLVAGVHMLVSPYKSPNKIE